MPKANVFITGKSFILVNNSGHISTMKDLSVLVSACCAPFMPGLVDCLRGNGERNIRIIGVDQAIDPTIQQIVDAFYCVPRPASFDYVAKLLDICRQERVDIVMPCMSEELLPLIENQVQFDSIGTKLSVPDRRSAELTINKFKLYEFLHEKEFPVPRFALVKKISDLCAACEKCGYPDRPVCVKATELSGSRGVRVVRTKVSRYETLFHGCFNSFDTTLQELLMTLAEKSTIPEMMVMEFLPGGEGSVDLIADKGEILYMAYRTSPVISRSIPLVAELQDNPMAYSIARRVVAALRLTGSADLDFKNDDNGNPVLLEVNPRLAATMKIFMEGGLNLPYLRIKHLLGEKLPNLYPHYGVKMVRRYLEMFSK